eukprot:jgi/Pico_ML_1/50744/g1899.t2
MGLPDTRGGRLAILLAAFAAAYALGYAGGRLGSPDAEDALARCHDEAKKAQAWIVERRSCAFEVERDEDADQMAWEAAQFFARSAESWTSSCVYVQVGVGSDPARMQEHIQSAFRDGDPMHGCFKALFVDRHEPIDALQATVGAHGDECVLVQLPSKPSEKQQEMAKSVGELRGLQPDSAFFLSWNGLDGFGRDTNASTSTGWTMDADAAVRRARMDVEASVQATLQDVQRLEKDGYAVHALGRGEDGALGWALRIDGDLMPAAWRAPGDLQAFLLLAVKQEGEFKREWERAMGVCVDEEWDQSRACRCVPRRSKASFATCSSTNPTWSSFFTNLRESALRCEPGLAKEDAMVFVLQLNEKRDPDKKFVLADLDETHLFVHKSAAEDIRKEVDHSSTKTPTRNPTHVEEY